MVRTVARLTCRYIEYWRVRFGQRSRKEFCSIIRTNSGQEDQGNNNFLVVLLESTSLSVLHVAIPLFDKSFCVVEPSEDYYLLCDALEEDRTVREKLQIQKLVTPHRRSSCFSVCAQLVFGSFGATVTCDVGCSGTFWNSSSENGMTKTSTAAAFSAKNTSNQIGKTLLQARQILVLALTWAAGFCSWRVGIIRFRRTTSVLSV